jgi:phage baseplate assembly protein W
MTIYRGFSTYNRKKKFSMTDFELVKQDIFNSFNIRKGEKLMSPDFGTNVWGLMFEPLTDDSRQLVVEDVQRICGYDPRVSLDAITVTTYQHGINIQIELTYLTEDQRGAINIKFDNTKNTVTGSFS